jgi:hypothetical protein
MVASAKKKEQIVSERKQANALMICDMIRQQILLRAILARLEAPLMRTALARSE